MKLSSDLLFRLLNAAKDFFLVYADYKDNGQRVSEQMLLGIGGVIASVFVAVGVVPMGFENESAQTFGALLFAGWNVFSMFVRFRSKGQQIKLRADRTATKDYTRDGHIPDGYD